MASHNTKQRKLIHEVIGAAEGPLSAAEVHERCQERLPRIGQATVYRNLRQLVDEGELTTVELPGDRQRFERADLGHHHHFQCRGCDQVFDLDGCPGPLRELAPSGFTVERHEVVLYGLCSECA